MNWREILKVEPQNQYSKASEVSAHEAFEALEYQSPVVEIENEYGLISLTVEQRWAVGQWLNTIREHEPEHREIVQQHCDSDLLAREWYLLKAIRAPKESRRTCLQCRRWRGGECKSQITDKSRTDLPQELGSCLDYCPRSGDPDPRHGTARWPGLLP